MHLIKYILCLLAALQLRKIESTKLTAAARETETAPPRTAIYDCPAPLAEQFQNQLDRIHTDALLALRNSKHTAPPQLLDDTPLAPLATKTEQLLNSKAYKLAFKSATLLTCIAPPHAVLIRRWMAAIHVSDARWQQWHQLELLSAAFFFRFCSLHSWRDRNFTGAIGR